MTAVSAKFCLHPGAELAAPESGGRCTKNQITGPHLRHSRGACNTGILKSSGSNSHDEQVRDLPA